MQADQMAMVLRQREGLEGADLGVRMLQENLAAVYRPWLLIMLPLVACCLATGLVHAYLAAFLIWWLVPIGERVVVVVLSRLAFRQSIGCGDAVRETWRSGLKGVFWQLTILRLSPYRGLLTPVMALERPSYKAYRARAEALKKNRRSGLALTFAFVHGEGFMQLSGLLLAGMLMPQHAVEWEMWFDKLFGDGQFGQHIFNLLFALVILAVRPFYAAAGFGLYLARRTELEGWDIELMFRGMARRFAGSAGLLIAGCLGLFMITSADATAQEVHPAKGDEVVALSPVDDIREIVDQPPFKNEVEHKQYIDMSWMIPDDEPEEESESGFWDWLGLAGLFGGFGAAMVLKILAILLLGVLVYWAIRVCMKVLVPPDFREPDLPEDFGVEIFDEPVDGAGLPSDPGAVAVTLAGEGKLREALSLLIRAAIIHFKERSAIPIPAGATEGDCLRRIRGKVPTATFDHFRRVARLWQTLVYAARPISADQVIELANDFRRAYPVRVDGGGHSS